jgi:3-hydroxyisobutyrate dehydrogenase-like beta-hydroxyacid dehydrogenase
MGKLKLGILGFGEAGQSVASGFLKSATAEHPIEIVTWDILLPSNEKGAPLKAAADRMGVRTVGSAAELAASSDIVFSLVTTDQSLVAAEQIAKHLPKGILFLDCNSTSPGMKRDVARTIEAAGARSVEAAVMDLVPRWQHKVPMLVAGPAGEELIGKLKPFGVQMEAVGDDIGAASTIKMCRSVFMKGLDAILMECMVAAETAGVTDRIVASLQVTMPEVDWPVFIGKKLGGAAQHSGRRAGEMREVAATLRELGLEPTMAEATAQRLQWCADLGMKERAAATRIPSSIPEFVDDVRAGLAAQTAAAKAAE